MSDRIVNPSKAQAQYGNGSAVGKETAPVPLTKVYSLVTLGNVRGNRARA